MSISYSFGSVATGTTSVAPSYPATVPAGARAYMLIVNKTNSQTPTTPSGWDKLLTVAAGAGSNGANAGKTNTTLFMLHAFTSGSEGGTSVTVTITSGNEASAVIFHVTSTSGAAVDAVIDSGSQATAVTSLSVNPNGSDSWATGDTVITCYGSNKGTATFTAQTFKVSGTSASSSDVELIDAPNTGGNELSIMVSAHVITLSSSPQIDWQLDYEATSSATTSGGLIFLRLRETTLPTPRTALGPGPVFMQFDQVKSP